MFKMEIESNGKERLIKLMIIKNDHSDEGVPIQDSVENKIK